MEIIMDENIILSSGALISIAVSSDTKKVITGGQDKKVIVWNYVQN
jgi:hypothetical protein